MNELKIWITESPENYEVNLVAFTETHDTREFLSTKDGQPYRQQVERGKCASEPIIPLLSLSPPLFEQLLQQLVDYASKKGINPTAEYQQGVISAMKDNLNDLRAVSKIELIDYDKKTIK